MSNENKATKFIKKEEQTHKDKQRIYQMEWNTSRRQNRAKNQEIIQGRVSTKQGVRYVRRGR